MTNNRTTEQVRELMEEAKSELLESCEYVGNMSQRQSDVLEVVGKLEQGIAATLSDNHPYEQRITGDGDNWGEIMADAFDGLMASASESCTAKELDALESHISATLGSEPPYGELLRCLKNDWHISASWDGLRKFWCVELTEEGVKLRDATGGTLTAEQVRDAVLENFEETHETRYDHWGPSKFDWQAIADELNAAIGGGECEFKPFPNEDWSEPNAVRGVCSECSALMYGKDNFCPNCGKAVKR